MNKTRHTAGPSEAAKSRLTDLAVQLRGSAIAMKVWNQMLTVRDRARLGDDLNKAFRDYGGGVDLWMKLRHTPRTRALVDVAYGTSLIDEQTRNWLLREIDADAGTRRRIRPKWDKTTDELRDGERVVRRVRLMTQPTRVVQILDCFEAARWPRSIETPKEANGQLTWDQQTVHEAIRSLNEGLAGIRFHARDGAEAIYWTME